MYGKSIHEPNTVLDSYVNLNGEWDCCINRENPTDFYDKKILVPFIPETKFSGIQQIVQPEEFLHYEKIFYFAREEIKRRKCLL